VNVNVSTAFNPTNGTILVSGVLRYFQIAATATVGTPVTGRVLIASGAYFQRAFNSLNGSFLFPVGPYDISGITGYRPFTLTGNSTSISSLTAFIVSFAATGGSVSTSTNNRSNVLCNLNTSGAASNMIDFRLRSTFIGHAQDEHRDYQMLERNYVSVGGELEEITESPKNIGSEALSAFIFHQASQSNPVDLIGSMFIIEGLGNKLAGTWAEQIKNTLNLNNDQVSFLSYHSVNDESHLGKLEALITSEWMTEAIAQRIIKTAKVTARLYLLQLEEI
jgi:hypothetical protein